MAPWWSQSLFVKASSFTRAFRRRAERLQDLVFLGCRGNSWLHCSKILHCNHSGGRRKKKKWDSNCHSRSEHYDVVSAEDERELQSSVGGCCAFSLCSHIVRLNESQMSVSVLWICVAARGDQRGWDSPAETLRMHTVHIGPGKLHTHAGQNEWPPARHTASAVQQRWRAGGKPFTHWTIWSGNLCRSG